MDKKKFWIAVDSCCVTLATFNIYLILYTFFTNVVVNQGVNFLFNVPFYLSCGSVATILISFMLSQFKFKKDLFYRNFGIIWMIVGLILLISNSLFFVLIFDGDLFYPGPVSGYPLISFIMSIFVEVCGLVLFTYYKKLNEMNMEMTFRHPTKFKIFTSLYFIYASFYFADFFVGLISFDTKRNIVGEIPVLIMSLIPYATFIFHFFIFKEKYLTSKYEVARKFYARHCLYFAGLTAICLGWIGIYESIHPDFVVESLQSMFPVTFAGSIPATILCMILFNIILPVYLFIKYYFLTKYED